MTILRKLLPAPVLSVILLVLWLLLARSASAGQLMLGTVLALAIPVGTARLRVPRTRVRRPMVIMRYVLLVVGDVIHSNLDVALGLLAPQWKRPKPKFVAIPLDLRHPIGLAVLAMVTTVVPGTVWSELAPDRGTLLLHVWDVGEDEEAYIARYRARYEQPLREIFE